MMARATKDTPQQTTGSLPADLACNIALNLKFKNARSFNDEITRGYFCCCSNTTERRRKRRLSITTRQNPKYSRVDRRNSKSRQMGFKPSKG